VNQVTPLPPAGEVFLDPRGCGRAMRVSWHAAGPSDADIVVISLWRGGTCTGSFRLPADDVPHLVDLLRDGMVTRLRLASEI
jgi:hypothetical protein